MRLTVAFASILCTSLTSAWASDKPFRSETLIGTVGEIEQKIGRSMPECQKRIRDLMVGYPATYVRDGIKFNDNVERYRSKNREMIAYDLSHERYEERDFYPEPTYVTSSLSVVVTEVEGGCMGSFHKTTLVEHSCEKMKGFLEEPLWLEPEKLAESGGGWQSLQRGYPFNRDMMLHSVGESACLFSYGRSW